MSNHKALVPQFFHLRTTSNQAIGNSEKRSGFTIVELMIATTVFSVILLIMSAGLIYIGKVYYKSVAQSKTQEAARAIISDVSRAIQFDGRDVIIKNDVVCIGDTMFAFTKNKQVDNTQSGLLRANFSGSCDVASLGVNKTELVPTGMFLNEFSVTPHTEELYTISVRIVSVPQDTSTISSTDGTTDLFDGANGVCKGGAGSEFCATSKLTTTVKKRLQ